MNCLWPELTKGTPCAICGFPLPANYDETPIKPCKGVRLGDWTERLLASVGVTKERYIAAKDLFGFAPECSCDDRQEWLNRVSAWWRSLD